MNQPQQNGYGQQPEPQLNCECDPVMSFTNFCLTFFLSYFGLAFATRPRRSGVIGCLDQGCCPQQKEDDTFAKFASFSGIFLEWFIAVGMLSFVFIAIGVYGVTEEEGILFGVPAFFFFLLLPSFILNFLAGIFFIYYFWNHGKNFTSIPWWIYVTCVPSVFAWICFFILAFLVCMQSNGMNIFGSSYHTQYQQYRSDPAPPQQTGYNTAEAAHPQSYAQPTSTSGQRF